MTSSPSPLVDLYASLPHYLDHLEPVWEALPVEVRGRRWNAATVRLREIPPERTVLVASLSDHMAMAPRRTILVEHGAGQSYDGDPRGQGHGSYSGGGGLERVVLFVCPSQRVARRWSSTYPDARVVVAGSPRLDRLAATSAVESPHAATVALTFHWNCQLVPETRSAFPHYHRALPRLVAELRCAGVTVLGHGHPRMLHQLEPVWRRLKVPMVTDFDRVVARARVLVADNTSAMYEWAALDRPVVALNAPWYRRDISHGLRFWDLVPGRQVDGPEDLLATITAAIADPGGDRLLREAATAEVYAHRDGRAAARAAAAIVEVLDG